MWPVATLGQRTLATHNSMFSEQKEKHLRKHLHFVKIHSTHKDKNEETWEVLIL